MCLALRPVTAITTARDARHILGKAHPSILYRRDIMSSLNQLEERKRW
jgi:hypothetical protein